VQGVQLKAKPNRSSSATGDVARRELNVVQQTTLIAASRPMTAAALLSSVLCSKIYTHVSRLCRKNLVPLAVDLQHSHFRLLEDLFSNSRA
jgi:hypothetical protein